jgi:large subunit ribosomal protein L35
MPKVKTHSGAKKRFSARPNGTIKRKHAFKNHMLNKKQTKRKRRLTHSTVVHKVDQGRIKRLLQI